MLNANRYFNCESDDPNAGSEELPGRVGIYWIMVLAWR